MTTYIIYYTDVTNNYQTITVAMGENETKAISKAMRALGKDYFKKGLYSIIDFETQTMDIFNWDDDKFVKQLCDFEAYELVINQ